MIQYLTPPLDYSSICRNKVVQASPWSSTIKVLFNMPGSLNPLVKDQEVFVIDHQLYQSLLSVSNLDYQSDYNPDSQVYTHSLSFIIYNSDYQYLQSIQGFLQSHKFSVSLSDGSTDFFIGVEGCQLAKSSILHNSQEQSISIQIQALSSYNILPLSIVPLVPPVNHLYIRGTLDPSLIQSLGGITFNHEAYFYKDLTLDAHGNFSIEFTDDTIMSQFSTEWLLADPSPLLSIDLSDFEAHNDITNLSTAFKGNSNLQTVLLPQCPNVTTFEECCYNCTSLTSFSGQTNYNGVQSFKRCFQNCTSLQEFSFGYWNIQSDPDCSYMFTGCTSLTDVDVDKLTTVSKIDFMFAACNHLTHMNLYSKVWNVTSAENTFAQCTGLEYLTLWGMDPLQEHPGQFASNNFFPSGAVNLVVDFHSSHAHGYNITMLSNQSLSNYLQVLAHIPASFAGYNKDVTLTSDQDLYIQSVPLLLQAKTDAQAQGWSFWYV